MRAFGKNRRCPGTSDRYWRSDTGQLCSGTCNAAPTARHRNRLSNFGQTLTVFSRSKASRILPNIPLRVRPMPARIRGIILAVALAVAGCHSRDQSSAPAQEPGFTKTEGPPTSMAAGSREDGQWMMPAKDYASTRYSQLDEINLGNAKDLKLAWTFSTGVLRGHEAAPLVVNNTMYLVTPFPNLLYALDLTKEGAPVKWSYDPKSDPSSQGVACCDVVNRGASYYEGRIYYNTLDGRAVAIDAKDGHLVWQRQIADINKGESLTMAPVVVKGKVLSATVVASLGFVAG
jgi:glucose dehydrogenase